MAFSTILSSDPSTLPTTFPPAWSQISKREFCNTITLSGFFLIVTSSPDASVNTTSSSFIIIPYSNDTTSSFSASSSIFTSSPEGIFSATGFSFFWSASLLHPAKITAIITTDNTIFKIFNFFISFSL